MSFIEDLEEAIRGIKTSRIVSCPIKPMGIPGIDANLHALGECLGTISVISVPKSGRIVSATYYDLDDEGKQTDLEIFKAMITQVADNAAWTLSAADNLSFITELAFFSFDDHTATQTSELTNIGKDYTAPEGKFYIQAVDRVGQTIAAGASPRYRLQIESFDPDFTEV